MSESFGKAALRLAAVAAEARGWRPREFWAATPLELATTLGLLDAAALAPIDRNLLQRMMDDDHDRPG